jgi:hypothetical protein
MDSARASLLKRRNYGRELLPRVREFLRAALGPRGLELELATLEESDEVYAAFEREWASARNARSGPGVVLSLEESSQAAVMEYITDRRGDLPAHEELFLFLPQWWYCGAVKIDIGVALDAADRLAALDQEDLLACSRNGTVGVVLEHFSARGGALYRFLAWKW